MPDSGIAAVPTRLRSQFLDGLILADREKILAAATPRRFFTNYVVTNQGHPADHFFLLTKGLARFFFVTEEGRKLLFQWLGPGDLFGGRTVLSDHCSYLFSTETVTDSSVLVWDRSTIRGLAARYPRLLENALSTASDSMRPMVVKVGPEIEQFVFEICRSPEQYVIQILPSNGAD